MAACICAATQRGSVHLCDCSKRGSPCQLCWSVAQLLCVFVSSAAYSAAVATVAAAAAAPQVLMSKSADKLRSELLVGFDPVNHYLLLLTQRYGHMAQFCADSSSGFPAVGIKWQPAAFLPAPLKPNLAHAQMEILSTSGAAAAGAGSKAAEKGGKGGDSNSNDKKKTKKGSSGFNSKGLVVPNLPQVLCEAAEMGLGLVEEVLLL